VFGLGQSRSKILPFPKKGIAQTPASASNIDISASSGWREPALVGEDLQNAVSRILLYGTFRESAHSADDRSYRNVSHDDMLHMLEGQWTLAAQPEWDEARHNWKYKLKGQDIDGDELVLLVALNVEEQMITIITKF
jgi:hypothetical protein